MILDSVFSPDAVIVDLESTEKDELFEEMVQCLVSHNSGINRDEALEALRDRESKMSTGIMHGIAVPHGNCESVKGVVGCIGISHYGISYQSLDGSPVNLVFMLLCNPGETERHLSVLKEVAAVLQNPAFMKEVMELKTPQEVYDLLCRYEAALAG